MMWVKKDALLQYPVSSLFLPTVVSAILSEGVVHVGYGVGAVAHLRPPSFGLVNH
jgi:hypothetical protein